MRRLYCAILAVSLCLLLVPLDSSAASRPPDGILTFKMGEPENDVMRKIRSMHFRVVAKEREKAGRNKRHEVLSILGTGRWYKGETAMMFGLYKDRLCVIQISLENHKKEDLVPLRSLLNRRYGEREDDYVIRWRVDGVLIEAALNIERGGNRLVGLSFQDEKIIEEMMKDN